MLHGVLITEVFERQAQRAGVSEEEFWAIVLAVASDPLGGTLIPGTGGARKVRHRGRGKGKSGGYRTVHYFAAEDVPVFLLALVDKGERADLTQRERNELAATLPLIAESYRRGATARANYGRRRPVGRGES